MIRPFYSCQALTTQAPGDPHWDRHLTIRALSRAPRTKCRSSPPRRRWFPPPISAPRPFEKAAAIPSPEPISYSTTISRVRATTISPTITAIDVDETRLGYIEYVAPLYVALRGPRYDRAVEVSQSHSPERCRDELVKTSLVVRPVAALVRIPAASQSAA
jgi:hypothetical protein